MEETLKKILLKKGVRFLLNKDDDSSIKVVGNIDLLTAADKLNISKYKFEILKILKEQEKSKIIQENLIEKIPESSCYKLSPSQHRLWLISQFEEASIAYNMPLLFELPDNYKLSFFKKAICTVIKKHEILRTIFKIDKYGEVRQYILAFKELDFSIKTIDFSKQENRTEIIQNFIKKDSSKPFNLEKGPLFRVSLLKTDRNKHLFYYNMHHIISDGWSMNILKKDILSSYKLYESGATSNLPNLRIQYKDYASWQLNLVNTEKYKIDKEYWLDKFKSDFPLINLPISKKRPVVKTYKGRSLVTLISKELNKKLKDYTNTNGGTLFMGLLSSIKILLYKYTGVEDIVIGTPVAGRNHFEFENQIGCYINTLAIRSQIDKKESFNNIYNQLKQNMFTAYNHQHYPFDSLVEDLNLKRNTSRSPLFDLMIALDNTSNSFIDSNINNSLIENVIDIGKQSSKLDMTINFQEIGEYISFNITFNTDVYEKDIIEKFMYHYKQLLKELLNFPTKCISEINFLSPKEEDQLLVQFNLTKSEYPKNKSIIELFKEQVFKTPDNIALKFENIAYSYKELDEISSKLANYLIINYKIQAEEFVGINLDRSDWVIISMLGILKTGGAYVPIDSNYPKERVNYLLNDSNCKVLINHDELGIFRKNIHSISIRYPLVNIQPDNLVYLIYTSGSTGNPKGVQVENNGLINHIKWFIRDFSINQEDSTVLITSYSFDGSVTSIWASLLSGATLHILNSNTIKNPAATLEYIERYNISFLKLVPSLFSSMVATNIFETNNCLKNVRFIKLGGENIILSDLEKCFEKYPNIKFANHYGTTETTIGSVIHHLDKTNFKKFSLEPVIGKPIDNFRIFILDEFYKLVPIGVTGMIYIGGDGVSRGYLKKEELNKEKFIKGLFDEKVVYKTGDFGFWTKEGTIIFTGRQDDQVKIRGYRIELGEIESALNAHKNIQEGVVIVLQNDFGEKELVAYFVADIKLSFTKITTYLKNILPEFMIPSYFVQLKKFPLTENGKINKKKLPKPEKQTLFENNKYKPPITEIEKKMVVIWEEILNRKKIGIEDSFFELGGHSLKIVRLINKIEQLFEIKMKIETVFFKTTIKDLSKEIERITWLNTQELGNNKSKSIEI